MLQTEVIGKVFLFVLAIIFSLGIISTLPGGLSAIGGGNTSLAYGIAARATNNQLQPFTRSFRYNFMTTADATLHKYFYRDAEAGRLLVGDGLRGATRDTNPLQVYPFRIEEKTEKKSSTDAGSDRSSGQRYLYLHVLGCSDYLEEKQRPKDSKKAESKTSNPPNPLLSEAESNALCQKEDGVFLKETSLDKIVKWLEEKKIISNSDGAPAAAPLPLPSTIDSYLKEVLTIFLSEKESDPDKVDSSKLDTKVSEIFILQTKLEPGKLVYAVSSPPAPETASHINISAANSSQEAKLLKNERIILTFLLARAPILFVAGIAAPGLLYIMRHRYLAVQRCMKPYLLLMMAQVATMLVGSYIMGEGLAVWIGLLYTSLRIIQLAGCIDLVAGFRPTKNKEINYRTDRPPCLLELLIILFLLWTVNGLGLAYHVTNVLKNFKFISPS